MATVCCTGCGLLLSRVRWCGLNVIWRESFLISVPHSFEQVLQIVGVQLCVKQRSSHTCSTNARLELNQPVCCVCVCRN